MCIPDRHKHSSNICGSCGHEAPAALAMTQEPIAPQHIFMFRATPARLHVVAATLAHVATVLYISDSSRYSCIHCSSSTHARSCNCCTYSPYPAQAHDHIATSSSTCHHMFDVFLFVQLHIMKTSGVYYAGKVKHLLISCSCQTSLCKPRTKQYYV